MAAADTPSPSAARRTSPADWAITPLPRSHSHSASRASGNAASCDSTNALSINPGS